METAQRRVKSLSNSCAFGISVFAWLFDTNPLVKPRKLSRTSMKKLKRGCRESKMLVISLFRCGGVSLENCCAKIPALKMKFALTPI